MEEKSDFILCCRHTLQPVDIKQDLLTLPQTLLNMESGQFLLAVYNERYTIEQDTLSVSFIKINKQ